MAASLQEGIQEGSSWGGNIPALWPTDSPAGFLPGSSRQNTRGGRGRTFHARPFEGRLLPEVSHIHFLHRGNDRLAPGGGGAFMSSPIFVKPYATGSHHASLCRKRIIRAGFPNERRNTQSRLSPVQQQRDPLGLGLTRALLKSVHVRGGELEDLGSSLASSKPLSPQGARR